MPQISRPAELRHGRVRPEVVEAQTARLSEWVERLHGTSRTPASTAELLADWMGEQVTGRARDELVERHRLQLQAAGDAESRRVLDRWERASERLGVELLTAVGAVSPNQDARLLMEAVDGLRLYELAQGDFDRDEVRRQLERLLSALAART